MADARPTPAPQPDGRDGSRGVRRRADGLGAGLRRRGRGGRRAVLQHRDDRLPGGDDRPLLRQAGDRLHLPAHRQCRRQRRGRRGGRGACARLPGARGGDRAEQLPRERGFRRLDAQMGPDRDRRARYAGADPAGAPRRAADDRRSRIARTGKFDLEALQQDGGGLAGARGHGPGQGGQPAAGRALDRRQVGVGAGV